MLISKYIHEKQKLLRAQGVTTILVPEDQIDDSIKQKPLSILTDTKTCPYCQVYYTGNCRGCPMAEAWNKCEGYGCNSTYFRVRKELGYTTEIRTIPGLKELIDKYNKELKETLSQP